MKLLGDSKAGIHKKKLIIPKGISFINDKLICEINGHQGKLYVKDCECFIKGPKRDEPIWYSVQREKWYRVLELPEGDVHTYEVLDGTLRGRFYIPALKLASIMTATIRQEVRGKNGQDIEI